MILGFVFDRAHWFVVGGNCWRKKSQTTTWDVKNHVNGINHQAQLVNAEFLNHQQYLN